MRLSTTWRAWERWQCAAGTWRGWSVCPALVAPEVVDIRPRRSHQWAARGLAERAASSLQIGLAGTALMFDLDPLLGIWVAARLNQLRLANAVLLLPRWPYHQAVLPVDSLIDGLVRQAARLSPGDLPNVAFVLDAQRTHPIAHRARNDQRADNRYRLTLADLPTLNALRARGIERIIKFSYA